MSEHPVTLAVSDCVYNRAQQIAQATSQSVEQVLARQPEESFTQPLNIQTKPENFKHLASEEDMIHIEPLSGPEIVERLTWRLGRNGNRK